MKQNFDKAVFVGTLDQFAVRDVNARVLGRMFGIDCRLAEFIPAKRDESKPENKSEVPA